MENNTVLAEKQESAKEAVMIDSQKELLKLRMQFKPRSGCCISHAKPDDESGQYVLTVTHMMENPIQRVLDVAPRIVLDGDYPRFIENFSRGFMLVKADIKRRHQFEQGIWLSDDGQGKMELFVKAGMNKFQSLMTGILSPDLPDGCLLYLPFWTPPSGIRKETIMYYESSLRDLLLEVSSSVTTGAMDKLILDELSIGDGNKSGGRMACPLAPIKTIGYTSNYAIYDGKFADNLIDGMTFATDKAMAKWLSIVLGVKVAKKAARGLFMQARQSGVAKCSLTVVSEKMMQRMYQRWGGTVYGDGSIDVYMDKNALKADFDFGREIAIHVLDVAKASPAYTSVQVLRKLASSGVDRTEFMEFCRDLFQEDLDSIFKPIREGRAVVPSIKSFKTPNLPIAQLTGMVCTKLVFGDRPIFKAVIGNGYLRKLVNNANMLRHEIDGMFGRLQADIGIMFDHSLLQFGEVFIAGRKGKDMRGKTVRMFKYPTIGLRESYEAVVVSTADIINRVWSTGWDSELCLEVINYYKSLQEGVLVVPALKEIMNLLAGCDYDWDGALVIFDQRFVHLMRNCKPLVVKIDTSSVPKDTNKVAKFCLDNIGKFIFGTLQRQRSGSSIGVITNESDVNDALLSAPFEIQEKAFRRIFDIMPEREYVGLKYSMIQVGGNEVESVTVCPDDIRHVYNEIRHSYLTPESVARMIKDMNVIFRMLQELTIDSVKTGVFVKPAVKYSKYVTSDLHRPAGVRIEWSKDGAGEVVCSL